MKNPLAYLAVAIALWGCSSAPKVAEFANGLKVELPEQMTLTHDESIGSALLAPNQKFHARVYHCDQSQETVVKFFEAKLPNAFKDSATFQNSETPNAITEVKFYVPPAGAPKPKNSDEANIPRNIEITIQPEVKGNGCKIQMDELVPPPP